MAGFDVSKLFYAKSFVVIGATDKPGPGGGASRGIAMGNSNVRLYYVNPNHEEILGRKCYRTLAEVPETVDCAVICTSAKLVAPYLEEAGQRGIHAAVVYASGFSEENSPESCRLEADVLEICRRHDITLCGPNCMGFINNIDRVSGYGSLPVFPDRAVRQGLGVVSQSGYINSYFIRNYPEFVAYAVSAGNGCTSSLEDFLLFYAENDHVSCIAAYMEGIKNANTLERALKIAAEKRKPVVVLKSGRSRKGAAAAASHTGNLSGDYSTFESVFKKFGVISTDSLEEFSVTAKMFAVLNGNWPKKAGIGAINFSGGENTLCADYCERFGLELPQLEQATLERFRALIPPYSTASNPLDPTTTMFTEEEKVRSLFQAFAQDAGVGMILLGSDLGEPSEPKDITCAKVLTGLQQEGSLPPTVVIPSFEKPRNTDLKAQLERAGIPVLSTGALAYAEIASLRRFLDYHAEDHTLEMAIPRKTHRGQNTFSLSEADSKQRIAALGIPVPAQAKAATEAELLRALEQFTFPVVLKIDSRDILHKTEAGGVKVGIENREDAVEAFRAIMTSCRAYAPNADIKGVLIQEMARAGVEMILGIHNNEQFGPAIMVGLGGIFVELFKDVSLRVCPVNLKEAEGMIDGLQASPLFKGYRASAALDKRALAQAIVSLSAYAGEHRDTIAELDINPVVVYPEGEGILALDALVVCYDEEEKHSS